jgi:hypothetical protein
VVREGDHEADLADQADDAPGAGAAAPGELDERHDQHEDHQDVQRAGGCLRVISVRRSSGASSRSSATVSLCRENTTSTVPYASIVAAPPTARNGRWCTRKTTA